MRRLALMFGIVVLAACAKTDGEVKADSAAMTPPDVMAPAGLALADVAGKWTVRLMPETGDSTLLTYELTATGDTNGWSIKFPDRAEAVPVRVMSVAGDSVMIETGPYQSALQKGVNVTTNGAWRIEAGKLIGKVTAHYAVATADSVRVLRMEGTRNQ